ncbi:MAG: EAL domain-containing protein, partial [Aquincola sp.]|nr:EAL domain-containing protein [Aquincola sp.]
MRGRLQVRQEVLAPNGFLHAGSIVEKIPGDQRNHNTTVVFNREGKEIAKYRKIHLFDVKLADGTELALKSDPVIREGQSPGGQSAAKVGGAYSHAVVDGDYAFLSGQLADDAHHRVRRGDIVQLEGVLRWRHPTLGVLPPTDFFDMLQLSNLSDDVTLYMLREVVDQPLPGTRPGWTCRWRSHRGALLQHADLVG